MTERMTEVKGRCPSCGLRTLFVGDGGYLTCSNADCARPDAAHELIGEVADARQHGAFTFCPQLVGHASMREFAIKISQKQAAYADAVKALKARDDAHAALERVTDLHTPVQHLGKTWCSECSVQRRTGPHTDEWVAFIPHPCPTLESLENKEPVT